MMNDSEEPPAEDGSSPIFLRSPPVLPFVSEGGIISRENGSILSILHSFLSVFRWQW